MSKASTERRLLLGRLLRTARLDARLTQQQVASALDCRQGKINKIEKTYVAVSKQDLDRLIELYGIDAELAGELRELAALDRTDAPPRNRGAGPWRGFAHLIAHEPTATEILCWHSERIPGPLQSPMYMLRQHQPQAASRPEVTQLLREREARAQIFTIENPPRYRAILSESSLHRMPGGRSTELVVDLAEHLLKLTREHHQIELQILTFDAKISFVDSDFQILRFAEPEQNFAYIEYPAGSRLLERDEELLRFGEHWDLLNEAALSRADSTAFLEALAKGDRLPGVP
ncbi:MAG TPA: helix-turn-helix transcriptional regulator [Actinophytocola sp.]|nr:helix-turn-helix transcriptional regulator [Actinophytocola sp.]